VCGSRSERLHYIQQHINCPILSCFYSFHRRHPVHCWNTAKSTLSWVGQLLGPGIHPHDVGTDLSCEQSVNEGQLVRILHVQVFDDCRWSVQNNERLAKIRAPPVSQLAGTSFLGLALVFSKNVPSDLVASHRYHFISRSLRW